MRHVPLAEFQDRLVELVAAAEAGDEIVLTREGREVARVVGPARRASGLDAAIAEMRAVGKRIKAQSGPTTAEEIRAWIEEDRR